MPSPLISLDKISVRIDDRDILKQIDFTLHEQEIVTLIGPNGAGKSTLIKVLLGIVKASSGKIQCKKKLKFSYVPQKFNPSHSLPLRVQDLLALEKCDAIKKAEIICDTGISKLQDAKVQQLSGGERRRTEIARAVAINPKFILLDEPFEGLAPAVVHEVREAVMSHLSDHEMGWLLQATAAI